MRHVIRPTNILCGLACFALLLAGCGDVTEDREKTNTSRGETDQSVALSDTQNEATDPGAVITFRPRRGSSAARREAAARDGETSASAREVFEAPGNDATSTQGRHSAGSKPGDSESGDSKPAAASSVGSSSAAAPATEPQPQRSKEQLMKFERRVAQPQKDFRAVPVRGAVGGLGGPGLPVPAKIEHNTEAYDHLDENGFLAVSREPLSTFSIDVDTASYSNVRRFLTQNSLPPAGAVRIEEMVNYFPYEYPQPEGSAPFRVDVEVAGCPWTREHLLARIALQGREIETDKRPTSNLVFLLDVSGSMNRPNKLPLVKEGLRLLVEQLGENDRIAIVVYAGAAGLVLDSTTADDQQTILAALDKLAAGGSTNGGQGIQLAYQTAIDNFITGGTNRVILCTDGDFNVGVSSQSELHKLIEEKAKSGVFLSVLGFGTGNYKDSQLEMLADKGNGNYSYVDGRNEARKVLVDEMTGTLITIAKDVKIQVDFNPRKVKAYRLVGYENRMLANEDFRDDTKDAGEIGAGHRVTALYEIVPVGVESSAKIPEVEPSKYRTPKDDTPAAETDEWLTVRLRYKQPDGNESTGLRAPVTVKKPQGFDQASDDYQFAASVAEFGMLLRDSAHKGEANFDHVVEVAQATIGPDPFGYRAEFVELVKKARTLAKQGGR